MCSSKPKWSDPRQKDPDYLSVAGELGITNKKGKPVIKNQNQLYKVQKEIDNRTIAKNKTDMEAKEKIFEDRLTEQATTQATQRAEDILRTENQFSIAQAQQQRQFDQSMAAQEAALQAQLQAQRELQMRAEETALRSQVPQFVDDRKNARRIRSKRSSKEQGRLAAQGTSQLRIPLGIGPAMQRQGSGGGGVSPVKLNIGS